MTAALDAAIRTALAVAREREALRRELRAALDAGDLSAVERAARRLVDAEGDRAPAGVERGAGR